MPPTWAQAANPNTAAPGLSSKHVQGRMVDLVGMIVTNTTDASGLWGAVQLVFQTGITP